MRLAIVDTETSGLDPWAGHRVLSFACEVVDVTPRGIVTCCKLGFRQRIDRAAHAWQARALEVNGYDDGPGGAWERAPLADSEAAAAQWRDASVLLNGLTLCGQNVGFDKDFIDSEAGHHKVIARWARRHVEVMSYCAMIAEGHGQRDFGLEATHTLLGLPALPQHTAESDVARCRAVIAHVWSAYFPDTWHE